MTCFDRILLNLQQKLVEKQKQQLKHEWIKRNIKSQKVFICFITKRFVRQAKRREECDLAESLNRLMYAAVKRGTWWRKFKKYPWRKVYYFDCKEDLEHIMRDIYADMNFYLKAGGI